MIILSWSCPEAFDFANQCAISWFGRGQFSDIKSRSPSQSCHPEAGRLCLQENCQSYWCRLKTKPALNRQNKDVCERAK